VSEAAATTAAAAAAGTDGDMRDEAGSSSRQHEGFGVMVVDFVNSVGAIREAFSEFYGPTTFCTGQLASLDQWCSCTRHAVLCKTRLSTTTAGGLLPVWVCEHLYSILIKLNTRNCL